MGILYHGSSTHNMTTIEPKKSTHGEYVYATPIKSLAINFSGRFGNDLTYDIGHFDSEQDGPYELVELIPGAFDKMYSNSASIYTIPDDTFKDIGTGFQGEVVSEVGVNVINEDYYKNVYDALLDEEKKGNLIIYRYPNKPKGMSKDGSDILDKFRNYKNNLNKEFTKNEFNRLVFLHPNLIDKINDLSKEFNYDYEYSVEDLIPLFKRGIECQLDNSEIELYIDSAYKSITNFYPELKDELDKLYNNYLDEKYKKELNTMFDESDKIKQEEKSKMM